MKPFNLQAALAGDPVVTRDGRKVADYVDARREDDMSDLETNVDLVDGRCASCGSEDLTLVEDYALYRTVRRNADGSLECDQGSFEPDGGDDSERLFCGECGQYHHIPEELS